MVTTIRIAKYLVTAIVIAKYMVIAIVIAKSFLFAIVGNIIVRVPGVRESWPRTREKSTSTLKNDKVGYASRSYWRLVLNFSIKVYCWSQATQVRCGELQVPPTPTRYPGTR